MSEGTRYIGELVSGLSDARTRLIDDNPDRAVTADDEKRFAASWLNDAFADIQRRRLAAGKPKLDDVEIDRARQSVLDTAFHGARLWRTWCDHPTATNLSVIGTQPGRMELADGRIIEVPPVASTDDELRASVRALRANSRRPDSSWDHLNHELELVIDAEKTRLTAIDFVTPRPFVTLRRATMSRVTLEDLVANRTMSEQCGAFLAAAVRSKFRILVGGSMNTGKTVLLRALAASLSSDAQVVVAESQGELQLGDAAGDIYPRFIASMEARRAGADGHGEISLNDLIQNAQRMSPTCVIVGEVRGAEAVALAKAVQQGYQVMATIHGYSSVHAVGNAALYLEQHTNMNTDSALRRMADGIDLAVFMEIVDGRRVVAEVASIGQAADGLVKSDLIFDHTGVGYPLTEEIKRRLARFGYGDAF